MAKSLREYIDWLDHQNYIWPQPNAPIPVKATPFLKPLKGIRAVTWNIYGTLLRISDGELLFDHPQELRMQIAFEKTIREFNLWQSMTRKPGEPWKQLYEQYKSLLTQHQMAGSRQKGEQIEVDIRQIWRTILSRLDAKEYQYDRDFFGDLDEFSDKIAYFFQANLQGVAAAPNALKTLSAIAQSQRTQTLLANGQALTIEQLLRALQQQGKLPETNQLFAFDCLTLSFQEGVRKPSKSLYQNCLKRLEQIGIAPEETLHVSSQLKDDLAIARKYGMRTALYLAEMSGSGITKDDVQNKELRPDCLITNLEQLQDILQIEPV